MAEYCNPFHAINARLPKTHKANVLKIDEFNKAPLQAIAEAAAGCTPTVVTSSFPYRLDGKLTYRPVAVILSFDEYCELVNSRENSLVESVEIVDSVSSSEELERIASGLATNVNWTKVETPEGVKWRIVRIQPFRQAN